MADFAPAFAQTMQHEGGYSRDPADPGGETYMGIARRYHPGWPGWRIIDQSKGRPPTAACILDIHTPICDLVRKFYRQQFWDRLQGDRLPDQDIANELFDTAVNQGVHTAVKYLQQALNLLNRNQALYHDIVEDGQPGPRTLHALQAYLRRDPPRLLLTVINILQGRRYIELMQQNPTLEQYRGWFNRVTL